jgi:AraC-like DNA-binding protein
MLVLSKKHLEINLSKDIPEKLSGYTIPNASPLYGKTPSGKYLFQKLSMPACAACTINFFSEEKDTIVVVKDKTFFWLQIQLENTLHCHAEQLGDITLHEWSMNFFFSTHIYFEIALADNSNYSTFTLAVPAYVVESFAREYPLVQEFEKRSKTGKPQRLTKTNTVCSFEIIDLIHSVQKKGLTVLTPEAITDLLVKVFSKASSAPAKKLNIDEKTISNIYALQKFLFEHLQEDYPRSALMKKFGLSHYHFNSGFTKIYGVTPFKLLKIFRMREVKEKLENNPLIVLKEIAYTFKYNSPDALLHAYKDIYGKYPSTHKPKDKDNANN